MVVGAAVKLLITGGFDVAVCMPTIPRHPTREVRDKRQMKNSRNFQGFDSDTDIVPDI